MKKFLTTSLGRLRLIAFLEGVSLLTLVFIGMPLKYFLESHQFVQIVGPIHGAFFILFVFNALHVGVEQKWKFQQTTWKVLVASFIPFGTFYVDKKILLPIERQTESVKER